MGASEFLKYLSGAGSKIGGEPLAYRKIFSCLHSDLYFER